ncbi:hypothetical protein ACVBE9_01735 [Eionea flava]
MVKNLLSYRYFSELNINDQFIDLKTSDDYALAVSQENEQSKLSLSMHFTLHKPFSSRTASQ